MVPICSAHCANRERLLPYSQPDSFLGYAVSKGTPNDGSTTTSRMINHSKITRDAREARHSNFQSPALISSERSLGPGR